ncbi:HAD family hydrolase [Streptomyces millisiae]|uniref:HAD family phosphatase n=1 Tax=Streptomyces millisiae TaxID=3075542 RepID=A0ABU2LWE2_9ACTN|nr:HAD family phosphatase [Streptomyces sp. DSM 44918]MDT0321902.1 HAD family phosphatase [Streptomyces sp. DSM 44918]
MPIDLSGYEALIFDFDGTLVDSQPLNHRALATALRKHGVTVAWEWYARRLGTSGLDLLAQLGVPREVAVDVIDVWSELIIQEAATLRTHQTVVRWVKEARRAGLRRAVASGGGGPVVRAGLAATGLASLFDVVVTREAVEKGKPAPDLFLLAAHRLGVSPGRCLVFEDADEGLEAARAAGMDAVDVRPWVGAPPQNTAQRPVA